MFTITIVTAGKSGANFNLYVYSQVVVAQWCFMYNLIIFCIKNLVLR